MTSMKLWRTNEASGGRMLTVYMYILEYVWVDSNKLYVENLIISVLFLSNSIPPEGIHIFWNKSTDGKREQRLTTVCSKNSSQSMCVVSGYSDA